VTKIYEHAVRYGTATFELIPRTCRVTRRGRAMVDGDFVSRRVTVEGRSWIRPIAGDLTAAAGRIRFTVENSVYLQPAIHRAANRLLLLPRMISTCEARGYRS